MISYFDDLDISNFKIIFTFSLAILYSFDLILFFSNREKIVKLRGKIKKINESTENGLMGRIRKSMQAKIGSALKCMFLKYSKMINFFIADSAPDLARAAENEAQYGFILLLINFVSLEKLTDLKLQDQSHLTNSKMTNT